MLVKRGVTPQHFDSFLLSGGETPPAPTALAPWWEMEFPSDLLLAELGHLQLYNGSFLPNNFSGAYNDTDALLPTGVKVTIVVVYMIVCVVGLVGNFLVMYVIIR